MTVMRHQRVIVLRSYMNIEPGTLLYWNKEEGVYQTHNKKLSVPRFAVRIHWRTFMGPVEVGQREMYLK